MFWKRAFAAVRLVSAVIAAGKMSLSLLAMLGIALAPVNGLLDHALAIALSTPVSMIAAMVVGQWIGELADARWYRIEGGTGGASKRHLVHRLRFTRLILRRPFWYPNEDRISRELARTNRALVAVGITGIDALAPDAEKRAIDARDDYIVSLIAMIKALGIAKTARLSPAIARRTIERSASATLP